jgi:hypothetical protein
MAVAGCVLSGRRIYRQAAQHNDAGALARLHRDS